MQVGEEVEAQYVSVEDEDQLTEAPLAALQDNGKNSISVISYSRSIASTFPTQINEEITQYCFYVCFLCS